MAKKPSTNGNGGSSKTAAGGKAKVDSKSPGAGSSDGEPRVYLNDNGELCIGNECFTLTADQERDEVRVRIQQGGGCELDPMIDALKSIIGTPGSRTVFELEHVAAEEPTT